MYLVEASQVKEGSYYTSFWNNEEGCTELKEVSGTEYQEYNAKGGDTLVFFMGMKDLGELLPKIHWFHKIPSVTEVEVGVAWDKHPCCLYSFKVIRHLPMEEIDKYLEESRESLLKIAKENGDQGTIQAFEDYDYLKSIQE